MSDNNNNPMRTTKIIIPCRISFAYIWEPKSINGSEEKYSVSCIIDKSDRQTLATIEEAIEAAKENGKNRRWGGLIPHDLKLPLRDGDIERPDDEAYENAMFLNASSKDAAQIVDRKVKPIINPMDCRSGDYCNVSVTFYPYRYNDTYGVAAALGNIQKTRDGDRLAGRTSAASEFSVIEDTDDNEGVLTDDDLPDYFYANTLWLVLPSGRKLAYIKPRLQPNRFGRMAVTFEGLNAVNKWVRTETYSGKLVENITQATARDLLVEAMRRMELAGLEIVAHVHDEVIIESTIGKTTVEEVCSIMNQNPPWAEGFPLFSAGYKGVKFYYKD